MVLGCASRDSRNAASRSDCSLESGGTANAASFQTLLVIYPKEDAQNHLRLFDAEPSASSGLGLFTYGVILSCRLTETSIDVSVIYDRKLEV